MRFEPVKYDDDSLRALKTARALCVDLDRFLCQLKPGRSNSIAQTHLEDLYMRIGKAIAEDQIQRENEHG